MGAKKKLQRFADVSSMPHVIEPTYDQAMGGDFPLKGNWNKDFFKNDDPIVIELGCGKGEYAVQLGKKYPDKNFIGVDIKGARIWYGASEVRETGMKNVGFIRSRIEYIANFFGKDEVDEIWLTFSDPQPKKARKRLSSRRFIEEYLKFLKPGGIVHLKTDSDLLFESTLEEIEEHSYTCITKTWDLYGELFDSLDSETQEILNIKTYYEELFSSKGYSIKYCKFKIN
ncbi:MAG: tRNA (guanosine(46)-N7)-methyltransferase TrmB [Crocinitomicaceae bacterium]|nr:tRNA (guanosine(46)-N7)-methyltransferase TrmB [Crocinitomicaceae bacterium]